MAQMYQKKKMIKTILNKINISSEWSRFDSAQRDPLSLKLNKK